LRLDPNIGLASRQRNPRGVVSEARIDFLTLWASRDGYIPMDFSTKCARGHCAAEASEFWGGGRVEVDCADGAARREQTNNNDDIGHQQQIKRKDVNFIWNDEQRSDKIKRTAEVRHTSTVLTKSRGLSQARGAGGHRPRA
jgi:hypothetical protein